MSPHLNLSVPRCLLCRHAVLPSQKMFSVLGEAMKYRGYSLMFSFPEHGHHFTYTTVTYDGLALKDWRLCRYPGCLPCKNSPKVFLLHVDCTSFLRHHVPTINYSMIWLFGLWCGSYLGPTNTTQRVLLPSPMTTEDTMFSSFQSLPLELKVKIMEYCQDSPLWRFTNVFQWSSELFEILKTTNIRSLSIKELGRWDRSALYMRESIQAAKEQPSTFFRLGLDHLGIRFIQFLESYPDFYETSCPWYIIGKTSSLDFPRVLSNGYFLYLQTSGYIHWNTSIPPDLAQCQIFKSGTIEPKWIKCVKLNMNITGLSVFCVSSRTYGIYIHNQSNTLMGDMYQDLHLLQNRSIVQLFFPLATREGIDKVWIRWKEMLGRKVDPVLVVQTTSGRVCVFGAYIQREDENYEFYLLSNGTDSQFFYDQPFTGIPISYFGAYSQFPLEKPQPQPPIPVINNVRAINEGLFYSCAALEDVSQVYLWKKSRLGKGHCVGLLFIYSNGKQEALGQCLIGLEYIKISCPKLFSWNEIQFEDGIFGVDIRFPFTYEQDGWQTTAMQGMVIWWFDDQRVCLQFDHK